jgi:hypothetical protein
MAFDAVPREAIPWRLVVVTSVVAALLSLAGETATGNAGWLSAVCLGAAAAFVAVIASRRGYRASRCVAFAALTAVGTMVLWLPALLTLMLASAVAAPFDRTAGEPWYDYLAFPYAPLLLLAQVAALFVPIKPLRWVLLVGSAVGIAAMFVYVATLDVADEGANIGAGLLLMWLAVAVALVVVGVRREPVRHAASP